MWVRLKRKPRILGVRARFFRESWPKRAVLGGSPKGVKMGVLHENREKPSACFWRAFLGCPAVAGVFFDVRDRRSTDINFHLRFFLCLEDAFEIFFIFVKVG